MNSGTSNRELWHRRLVQGETKGWLGLLWRSVLTVLAWGYGLGLQIRSLAYSVGLLKTKRVQIPVISIGNLTAGGTGKTPFAAYVARWFRNRETRVVFLSRGYGADPGAVNDEALVLNLLCPDVPHLQNPDRVAGAETAIQELESQLAILDDAFQHRRIARDLDIVLIDATCPWGFNALLPRGYLREPLSALKRADVLVITRVDQISSEILKDIRQQILKVCPDTDCVEVSFPSHQLTNSQAETCIWEALTDSGSSAKARVIAFCGIGNPEAFRMLLKQHRIELADHEFKVFPDHHRYTRDDVEKLKLWATELRATSIVTTQKDLVKLELPAVGQIPLWAAEISTEIHFGQEVLEARFEAVLKAVPESEFEDWTTTPD